MEIWKNVNSFCEGYEVSNLGNVRSIDKTVPCKGGTRFIKGKPKKLVMNHKGYLAVGLSHKGKAYRATVHQLVALAFIPNFVKGTELNHIDGNKTNNCLSNLEVSNPSHNQLHAVRTGLKPKVGKSKYRNVTFVKNPKAKKKWAASIRYQGNSSYGWKTFMTEEEAARHVDSILDSIGCTERGRNFP